MPSSSNVGSPPSEWKKKIGGKKGYNKPSNVGFLVLLTSSASSNLVILVFTPFLPYFASQLGASVLEIGLVGGAGNIVYSFMPFVMGRLANTAKARRLLVVSSLVLLTIVSFLYFTANSPIVLILLKLFEGLGWSTFWPAIEATLTHDPTRDSKRSLATFNFSWSGAAAVGPLFGALLAFVLTIRELFLVTTILLFATLILNLTWIEASRRNSASGAENHNGQDTIGEAEAEVVKTESKVPEEEDRLGVPRKISPSFYLVAMALCAVSSSILLTFISPFGKSIGMSILMIGIASSVFGFARFGFYFLTTKRGIRYFLFNHERRVTLVLFAISVISLSSLLIMLPNQLSTGIYLISFAVVGIGYSVVYSIAQVALVAETSPEKMGTGAGLFESSIGVGGASGPVIAGVISGKSLIIPFITPTLCLLPALVILYFILGRDGKARKLLPTQSGRDSSMN